MFSLANIHARRFAITAGALMLAGIAVPATAHAATTSAGAAVADNVLTITGSSAADNIQIEPNAANVNVLDVALDGIFLNFDRTQFTTISVNLGNGNDEFVDQPSAIDEPVIVDGGAGNDVIIGGVFTNDVLDGGTGNDELTGAAGDDVLVGGSGNDVVTGGVGHDTALLGGGSDFFIWNPGDGSDVVDGGGSNDQLNFNGSNIGENMALSRVGSRAVLTRNVGLIRMDLDNIEGVNVRTLGGQDFFGIGDLRGTDVRNVSTDLSSFNGVGDAEADIVAVKGSDRPENVAVTQTGTQVNVTGLAMSVHVNGSDATDLLAIDAAGGNDKGSIASNVNAITPEIALGAGQH